MKQLWLCVLTLGGALLLAGCQSTGEDAAASSDGDESPPAVADLPPQGAGTMTHDELLQGEGMEPVGAEELRRYFTGNTVFWEPVGGSPRLFASYYDPSGTQRLRERRASEVESGSWRLDGERLCHRPADRAGESCGAFVATPDGPLAFCEEGGRCDWLVVGINEGNSLEL